MFPWEEELRALESGTASDIARDTKIVKVDWLHAYDTVKYTFEDGKVCVVRANCSTGELDFYRTRR